MSMHPTHEKLAEFAWDALEGAEADAVEKHVAACGDCALQVERVRAEARKLSAALELPIPAGLAVRILDSATPAAESGPRLAPWIGVAAAALFAVTAAWAWRGMESANRRIEKLEKELASRPTPGPVVANQTEDIDTILKQMARIEIEGEAGTVSASVPGLTPDEKESLRGMIVDAADTIAEVLAKVARKEIDWDTLEHTDLFASLDPDLLAKFERSDFADIVAALERPSRADAIAVARALVGDLVVAAGLDQAQASSLESFIVDKTAWRRDFHFLPDVVQRELAARFVGAGGSLRPETAALLSDSQKSRVLNYLASAATERNRYWETLKKNANKH
ncbi:MAG: hypothetical protein FD180_1454 [Planctomycetota bacterium]|nr:MAG: hypothetical protein FD180_1454 [Planctomycetota bacterium]